jgi:hypothetical protein
MIQVRQFHHFNWGEAPNFHPVLIPIIPAEHDMALDFASSKKVKKCLT